VARAQSAAHMLAVCPRTGLAVTASQDEDEVHVWDLAAEDQAGRCKLNPALKAPDLSAFKLKYDKPHSSFAFNFNLRR